MNIDYLKAKIGHLKEQRDRAVADANRFIMLNDALIEDVEKLQKELEQAENLWKATAKTLQDEIDRLTKELAEERKQHSDVAASCSGDQCECNRLRKELDEAKKDADHAKLMFNIAFSFLDQTGYDVEKLGHIVALRCALEERGLI